MLIMTKCSYYNEQHQLHRNDGPAVITSDGSKFWYQNDKLHREDGPAIEYGNGKVKYFLNNILITKEQFEDFRIMKDLQDSIKKELKC